MVRTSGQFSRNRSSTGASRALRTDENSERIVALLDELSIDEFSSSTGSVNQFHETLAGLRQYIASGNGSRDTFRRANGFQAVLAVLKTIKLSSDDESSNKESSGPNLDLLAQALDVLSEALRDHRGNERFFKKRVPGNGWTILQDALQGVQQDLLSLKDHKRLAKCLRRLYDCLIGFAIGEDAFQAISGGSLQTDARGSGSQAGEAPNGVADLPGHQLLHGNEVVVHARMVPIILRLGLSLLQHHDSVAISPDVLALLNALASSSIRNKVSFQHTNTVSILLGHILGNGIANETRTPCNSLLSTLADLGFNTLDELALLYRQASEKDQAKAILLDALQRSKGPNFVQFDLSLHGYSSIELPSLPRPFPPTTGYTVTAWLRIDDFDSTCHTTIFGAFDTSQTCFVLVYLEKDTHHLILQTSITSSRPSVRFKSTVFASGKWYHVALVHHKWVKDMSSSGAFLFVNGEFVEQVKCQYPEAPPESTNSPGGLPPDVPGARRSKPVQTFLGTPHDLALRLGRDTVVSRWSLASAHLYQTPLSDEFVAVHHRLGPRYSGNLQDCLGPLLTYRASAELNRYNELLHPEKTEKSDIIAATEGRGGDVVPETRLLLSITPTAISIVDDDNSTYHLSSLDLSKKAAQRYNHLCQKTNAIAINAAVPAINEAISRSFGAAILTGEPVIAIPQSLDDATWRLGGCLPLVLRLLEAAATQNAVLESVRIFFASVKDNWRISEAMEKGNGFGVFAMLLREKLGLDTGGTTPGSRRTVPIPPAEDREALPYQLLTLVLDFVGYNIDKPEDSMLVNPMAYRVLLIDFETWRRTDLRTQNLYYTQFGHFVTRNKHQSFNAKRLTRMRIVRRLIDALKTEDISQDALPALMKALKALVVCNSVHTVYRDLAMYVAFALQEERALVIRPLRGKGSMASMQPRNFSSTPVSRSFTYRTPSGILDRPARAVVARSELGVKVLELITELLCEEHNAAPMKRFTKLVPNRWMLHLLSETKPAVIELTLKLIAQALVVLGSDFKTHFVDKNGGFTTLRYRLKTFWDLPRTWTSCFAIMFGRPGKAATLGQELTLYGLIEAFAQDGELLVVNPEILPSITAMLEAGLRAVILQGEDEAPANIAQVKLLTVVVQFFNDLFNRSQAFREFAISSRYVQELLFVLFPLIANSDRLSAEIELQSEKGTLNFNGEDVVMRPHSNSLGDRPPSVRSMNLESDKPVQRTRALSRVQAPRRTSSFVFVGPDSSKPAQVSAHFSTVMAPKQKEPVRLNLGNALVESLLEVVVNVFLDQVCNRKDFAGLGLFLKVPPGFQEHQAYFESYVLLHSMTQLWNHLQLEQQLLLEPRVLTNLARYGLHMAEAVFEGWFINGAQPLLDFVGRILDYLQQPKVSSNKSVRLCTQAINTMRTVFLRVTLLRLSELDELEDAKGVENFLAKMNYWQTILFSSENQETPFIRLICYLLYMKLVSPTEQVRLAAASLWRTILVQKPTETATLLTFAMGSEQRHLSTGFMNLTSLDDDEFLEWVDEHRENLDAIFIEALAKPWEDFVNEENRRTEESAKNRLNKRREKLRQWQAEEAAADNFMHRYEVSTTHWRSNVHAQERLKNQRAMQDHLENVNHLLTVSTKLDKLLRQPCGLLPNPGTPKWQLDETEAVNRMRMRTLMDSNKHEEVYQPKRKHSERVSGGRLTVNTHVSRIISEDIMSSVPSSPVTITGDGVADEDALGRTRSHSASNTALLEGGFEIVDDPKEDEEGFIEDKNRKIMTSLQRGDEVQQLYNISRIVGLEACEGLIVVGKKCLYMQDNFFSRSDGEIVSVAQAPPDERDAYVQLISGKDVGSQRTKYSIGEQTTRHWTWKEVLSVSKRRFLFRDVAVEVFFTDGRSYLLTCITPTKRNDLYSSIINRAPHVHSSSTLSSEDAWRLDSLRNPEEAPQTFGSKFANVFNQGPSLTATKQWMRGEMSNFQYLMLVNTMAGRSFNDLTQYPVFPWVLADYTSDELDLTDPRAFRDLSKPMGCQNASRESDFRERYRSFAEMGDHNAPPFHYGTHYSSAMIVTSYLIRLQPFVQSHLLLQGGSFDHADRLFDSIGKAWLSASKDNMTDVRELTPEFFYFPEFLTNLNHYDFGQKQGTGEAIDDVHLPPWANGDPHVFIAKHREALESPYVSQHLHQWIDLVFGYKQRGEAAVEATNVFQHLSYHGAKDLDTIEDPVERLATIGIVHNFGQTPHQVFQRPHPAREEEKHHVPRLDTTAESLIRLPTPLFESDERVANLTFSPTQERLLCAAPCKLNMLPNCDRFVQWDFADHSIRFFSSNSKRLLGLFENTHIGPISTAVFADSKTLVTAGVDCTLAIWAVAANRDAIDIQPKTYLFGHRTAVTFLAASRVFSTLLSASRDGQVLLWDLNRHDCIRVLTPAGSSPVQAAKISNVTGHIVLCHGSHVSLYTLNGHLLLDQQVSDAPDDSMTCCAFYEGSGNEWLERELIFTGHAHGVANVWALAQLADGAWHLQLVKRLNHADASREDGGNSFAAITSVLPMAQTVYTGDEEGKVWEWDCVQRHSSFSGRR